MKFAWERQPQVIEIADSTTGRNRKVDMYQLIALKTLNGKPALSGDVVTSATADYDNRSGNYVSMSMKLPQQSSGPTSPRPTSAAP